MQYPEYRAFALWRLFAAILVMAYHFAHYSPQADVIVPWFERMNPLLDMFFVLSGFLIFERYGHRVSEAGDYARFLLRRLSRLYPLHLVTLLVFVVLGILVEMGMAPTASPHRFDFSQLPANLLLLQAWGVSEHLTFNYVSWSLSGEWFAYIMLPVIGLAFRSAGLTGLVMLLLAILATLELASWNAVSFYDTWYDAKTWGAYRILADFTFGAVLYRLSLGLDHLPTPPAFLSWAVLGGSIVLMHLGNGTYGSLALIGLAVVIGAVRERRQPDRSAFAAALMPAAALSYGVYMWHPVVEVFGLSAFWKWMLGQPDSWLFYPLALACGLATFAVSWVSMTQFEIRTAKAIMAKGSRVLDTLDLNASSPATR